MGATVPPALIGSTIKAAITVAAGKAANTVVTAKVAALTEGVLRTMFLTKITIATVSLVVGMMALGGGMLTYRTMAAEGALPLPVEQKEMQKQVGIAAIAEMQEPLEKLPGKRVTVSQPVQRKVAPFEVFTGRLEAVGALPDKPIGVRFDMDERSYLRYQRSLRAPSVFTVSYRMQTACFCPACSSACG